MLAILARYTVRRTVQQGEESKRSRVGRPRSGGVKVDATETKQEFLVPAFWSR